VRVAIYRRISTDEDHQPYSLDAQEQRLRAYVSSQPDWQLVRTFTDQASGATTDRPGLARALTEAKAGRYDLLLVYRVDRFARSVRGLATLLEQLDAAGVAFRSATEPFDTTTAAGRMMVQMLGVFAEFERATIIDRVISGMERKAARGEWCGGSRPYGYTVDSTTGYLQVSPDESPLVPIIFDLYVKQHLGAKSIGNWLSERGHRTRSGRPWNHIAVLTVLRNRAYVGEVFFRNNYHPAPHPPLIDSETFVAAQRILETRGENHSRRASNKSDYLLAGLISCTHCGARFVGGAANGSKYRYRYYTCFSRHRYGTSECAADRLPADELEAVVLARLADTYARDDVLARALSGGRSRAAERQQQIRDELAVTEADLAKAEEAIERYLLAFENGSMPEATCSQRVQALAEKASELREHRADLNAEADMTDTGPTQEDIEAIRTRISKTVNHGDAAAQKDLLAALVHDIQATGRDNIRPVFRIPSTASAAEQPLARAKVRKLYGSVPPGGFEPPPPAPEAGALSPELRGRGSPR
jgi:site-specific DNA recombinase